MKEDTKENIITGLKAIPFGVALGIITGLMFGFGAGCIVCGLSTMAICEYTLTNFEKLKSINMYKI